MLSRVDITKTGFWRLLIQWGFFLWILFIGVQFGLFVGHFEPGGVTALYVRPPGVEGFLPIGALASLKYWLLSGEIDKIHPAALVLFLTFLAMSLFAKKSFCSWLCPVGTLSEGLWKLGRRIFGRTFQVWRGLDILLRGLKYALLLFFIKILLIDMPVQALGAFLQSPYWSVSDVKMLHFFTGMSTTTLVVLALLAALSIFYQNAWCRYLCPYGALLGLLSVLSPMKIRRNENTCSDCHLCSKTCPSKLPVSQRETIHSPECNGCLSCVEGCPERALFMAPFFWKKPLPRWAFPLLVLTIYAGGVVFGMATGHWSSSLNYEDYQRLIPMASYLGH
jgi:polyferredoxin